MEEIYYSEMLPNFYVCFIFSSFRLLAWLILQSRIWKKYVTSKRRWAILCLRFSSFWLGLLFDPENGCRWTSCIYSLPAGCLLGLLLCPEDGGNMFFWNVGQLLFFIWLTRWLWRWRQHVPLKRRYSSTLVFILASCWHQNTRRHIPKYSV